MLPVCIKMPKEVVKKLDEYARSINTTRSEFVRRLVEDFFKDLDEKRARSLSVGRYEIKTRRIKIYKKV